MCPDLTNSTDKTKMLSSESIENVGILDTLNYQMFTRYTWLKQKLQYYNKGLKIFKASKNILLLKIAREKNIQKNGL